MNEPGNAQETSCDDALPQGLPYDPVEWERRLAVARVKRKRIQEQRAAEERARGRDPAQVPDARPKPWEMEPQLDPVEDGRGVAAAAGTPRPEPGPVAAGSGRGSPFDAARFGGPVVARPAAVRAPVAGAGRAPAPRSAWRARPVLLGLVVGCVVGMTLASLGDTTSRAAALRDLFSGAGPSGAVPSPALVERSPPAMAPPLVPRRAERLDPAPAAVKLASRSAAHISVPSTVSTRAPVWVQGGGPHAAVAVVEAPGVLPPPQGGEMSALHAAWRDGRPTGPADRPLARVSDGPGEASFQRRTAAVRAAERVVLHIPENMAPDRQEALLSRLSGSEWRLDESVTSPHTIGETHVRYYHDGDREAAEALAGHLEAPTRDFTGHRPRPDEGLLELWLSGRGAAPRVARQAPARATPTRVVVTRAVPVVPFRRQGGVLGLIAGVRDDGASRRASASSRSGDDGFSGGTGETSSGSGGSSSGGGSPGGSGSSGRGGSSSSGGSSGGGSEAGSGGGSSDGGRGGGNGNGRGNGGDRGASEDRGNGNGGGNNGRGGGNGGGRGNGNGGGKKK